MSPLESATAPAGNDPTNSMSEEERRVAWVQELEALGENPPPEALARYHARKAELGIQVTSTGVTSSTAVVQPKEEIPEPAIAYVYPWHQYVIRSEVGWEVGMPLVTKAAKNHLDHQVLPPLLLKAGVGTAKYGELSNTRNLPDHELCARVHSLDCCPGKPEIFARRGLTYLNTYRPPTLAPRPGKYPRIERLIQYLTASDGKIDEAAVNWLCNWVAQKLQHPGENMPTSPILAGTQGSGKNTFYEILRHGLGPHNCTIIGPNDLKGSFNAHYATKLFVFANECVPPGEVWSVSGNLKAAISDDEIQLNAKNTKQIPVKNRAAYLFASNYDDPIHIEHDDRRFSLFENREPITAEHREFMRWFYARGRTNVPSKEFKIEIAAFMYDALNFEVDYELLRVPYDSRARRESIEAGLDSQSAFAREVAAIGFEKMVQALADKLDCPTAQRTVRSKPGAWTMSLVHSTYRAWCMANGKRAVSSNKLGRTLRRAGWRRDFAPDVVYWPPPGSA